MTFIRASFTALIAFSLGGCLPIERIYKHSEAHSYGTVTTTISRLRVDVARSKVVFVKEIKSPKITRDSGGGIVPTGGDTVLSFIVERTGCSIADDENWDCIISSPYYSMISGQLSVNGDKFSPHMRLSF